MIDVHSIISAGYESNEEKAVNLFNEGDALEKAELLTVLRDLIEWLEDNDHE